jgi:hypothetical protein
LNGEPIENKTYEMKLNGGTPFERDIELPIIPDIKGVLSSFLQAPKPPRLSIRVWKMSRAAMDRLK